MRTKKYKTTYYIVNKYNKKILPVVIATVTDNK